MGKIKYMMLLTWLSFIYNKKMETIPFKKKIKMETIPIPYFRHKRWLMQTNFATISSATLVFKQ